MSQELLQTVQIGWRKRFFTITVGQTISLVGSSAVQFALIWWLASETSSPMVMAMSGLVAFLPQAFLGPFAGVWIDRMKRKHVVIAADLFIGAAALVFAGVFAMGDPPYWSVFVVLGIRAVGNVFHTPAIQAVIPMLVPKEELVRANGWSQFMQSGAFMLGPVIGAMMYGVLPMSVILLTDFLGALVACAAVAAVAIPELKQNAQYPHFWREMKEGAAVFKKDKKLAIMLIAGTIGMVFFLPLSSFYPLMTSSYFEGTAFQASLVEFVYAAGMLGSSFVIGMFGKINRKLFMSYMGLLGMGVTSLVCGIVPSDMWGFWIFAVMCCIMGASGNIYNIPCIAYMQENVAPEAQGRAFSLIGSMMSLAMPVGLIVSGPVAESYGVPAWFLITGISIILLVAVCLFGTNHAHTE